MNINKGIDCKKFALNNVPGVTFCVVVMLAALAGISFTFTPVEAARQSFLPPYLEQLDGYQNHTVEYFRREEERRDRSRRLEESVQLHTIKRGETLSEIARTYDVDVEALAYWNNIDNPDRIREGAALRVLTVKGTLHHVDKGDTLTSVASRYNVETQTISDFNMLEENRLLEVGKNLVIPGSTTLAGIPDKEVTVLALASRGGVQAPVFRWPLRGIITSYYGVRAGGFHHGLDIAAPHGTEIRAAASGVVEYAGVQRGYGLMLIIDHGYGWSSLYAHNSRLMVSKGRRVTAGQSVALVGASGNATGPHLHLEIMHYDKKLDPMLYLP